MKLKAVADKLDSVVAVDNGAEKVFRLKKSVKIGFFLTVAAILVLIMLLNSISNADKKISLYYSANDNSAVLFLNEKKSDFMGSGNVSVARYGKNGVSAAILTGTDRAYSLYFANYSGAKLVTEKGTNQFAISYYGDAIVFLDSTGVLYIYNSDSRSPSEISLSAEDFAISPDGKTVLYTVNEDGNLTMYIYSGKKSTPLGNNYIPLGISNDNSYIYAVSTGDNSLCLVNKDGTMKSKLCSNIENAKYAFSDNMEEIVFFDGSYTYISVQGKSRIRITSNQALPFNQTDFDITCDSQHVSFLFDGNHLTEKYYYISGDEDKKEIFYVDKNCNRNDVANLVVDSEITSVGMYYMTDDGTIFLYDNVTNINIASSATAMVATSNGKYLYYLDNSSNLKSVYKGEQTLLASGAKSFSLTGKGVLLYLMTDGRLCWAEKNDNGDVINTNVYSCSSNRKAAFYVRNYDNSSDCFELYSSDGSEKFNLVSENISWIL